MKVPPSQRSTYGPNGLDHEFIAKKVMGAEGFQRVKQMAKDPTLYKDFSLYSVHVPIEAARFPLSSSMTVKLKRINMELSWDEFVALGYMPETRSRIWFTPLADHFDVERSAEWVTRVEDAILTQPIEDPFATGDMMEEL